MKEILKPIKPLTMIETFFKKHKEEVKEFIAVKLSDEDEKKQFRALCVKHSIREIGLLDMSVGLVPFYIDNDMVIGDFSGICKVITFNELVA